MAMNSTSFTDLCIEYEAAVLALEKASDQVRCMREASDVDALALEREEQVYSRARLYWLSANCRIRVPVVSRAVPDAKKILLLEANSVIAESVRVLSQLKGYSVVVADHQDIPATIERFKPDLVLIGSSVESAPHLARCIRELATDIRIIAMLWNPASPRDRSVFDDVIVRPLSVERLLELFAPEDKTGSTRCETGRAVTVNCD